MDRGQSQPQHANEPTPLEHSALRPDVKPWLIELNCDGMVGWRLVYEPTLDDVYSRLAPCEHFMVQGIWHPDPKDVPPWEHWYDSDVEEPTPNALSMDHFAWEHFFSPEEIAAGVHLPAKDQKSKPSTMIDGLNGKADETRA